MQYKHALVEFVTFKNHQILCLKTINTRLILYRDNYNMMKNALGYLFCLATEHHFIFVKWLYFLRPCPSSLGRVVFLEKKSALDLYYAYFFLPSLSSVAHICARY